MHPFIENMRQLKFQFLNLLQQSPDKQIEIYQINHLENTVRVRKFCEMLNSNGEDEFARGVAIGIAASMALTGQEEMLNLCEDVTALIAIFTVNNINILTGEKLRDAS